MMDRRFSEIQDRIQKRAELEEEEMEDGEEEKDDDDDDGDAGTS